MAIKSTETPTKTSPTDKGQTDDTERLPELDDDIEPAERAAPAVAAQNDVDDVAETETEAPEKEESPRDALVRRYRELRAQQMKKSQGGDEDAGDEAGDDGDGEADTPQRQAAAPAKTEPKPEPAPVTPPVKEEPRPDPALEANRALLETVQSLVAEVKTLRGTPAPAAAPAATDDEPEPAPKDVKPGDDHARLEAIVERIQIGDKAEGRQALSDLIEIIGAGKVEKGMAPEEITRVVQSHLAQERVNGELQSATTTFRTKYKGLVEDPDLLDMSLRRLGGELADDLVKAGIPEKDVKGLSQDDLMRRHQALRLGGANVRSYDALLEKVGADVSTKFGAVVRTEPEQKTDPKPESRSDAKPQPRSSPTAVETRLDRKQRLGAQPRAAGVRSDSQPQQKPKSRADVIQEMRRSRGYV